MNKKDCEQLGYILSHAYEYEDTRTLIAALIKLDPRIEEEFLAFSEVRLRNEKIEELMTRKLVEKFGMQYEIKKACNVEEYRKARKEAEKELEEEDL